MIKKNIFRTLFISFILLFSLFSFVNANPLRDRLDNIDGDSVGIKKIVESGGMATNRSLPMIVSSITKTVLGFFALITLIFIIQSGIKWFSSQGMPDKIKESRKVLSASIIGMIIVTTAYASTDFVIDQIMLINQENKQDTGFIGNENDNCISVCDDSVDYDNVWNGNGCKSNSVSSGVTNSTYDDRCGISNEALGNRSIKTWSCVCGQYESVSCYACKVNK